MGWPLTGFGRLWMGWKLWALSKAGAANGTLGDKGFTGDSWLGTLFVLGCFFWGFICPNAAAENRNAKTMVKRFFMLIFFI